MRTNTRVVGTVTAHTLVPPPHRSYANFFQKEIIILFSLQLVLEQSMSNLSVSLSLSESSIFSQFISLCQPSGCTHIHIHINIRTHTAYPASSIVAPRVLSVMEAPEDNTNKDPHINIQTCSTVLPHHHHFTFFFQPSLTQSIHPSRMLPQS